MRKSTEINTRAELLAQFYFLQFYLKCLYNKDLEGNVNLHFLHFDFISNKLMNILLDSFIMKKICFLLKSFLA